jgi:hypothetical protein
MYDEKYCIFINQISISGIIFAQLISISMYWGACHRQLMLTHKPLVQLLLLWWTIIPKTMRTYACLWCRCPFLWPNPRRLALMAPHFCCSTASRRLDISAQLPMLCCTFLLTDQSQAPWPLPDLLNWSVPPLLTQDIFLVAALPPLHRPD